MEATLLDKNGNTHRLDEQDLSTIWLALNSRARKLRRESDAAPSSEDTESFMRAAERCEKLAALIGGESTT